MIVDLVIRNLGVIAESELEFSSGMVAFTGETGAGKTMLVGALGLVLGDRADTSMVAGPKADVAARVLLDPSGEVAQRITELGGQLDDDGTVLVSRSVAKAGRGRAAVGGTPVPVAVLSDIGRAVAERHSQSDQIHLKSNRRQRDALDTYAGTALAHALDRYRSRYRRYLDSSRRLLDLREQRLDRDRRTEELQIALARIDAVQPQVGEQEELPAAITRLANVERIAGDVRTVLDTLEDGDTGVLDEVAAAQQVLAKTITIDASLRPIGHALTEAAILLEEATGQLRRHAEGLNADPARLEELQQRKAALAALTRDFGPTTAEVVTWAQEARAELQRLTAADDDEAELADELQEHLAALATEAETVSNLRRDAAQRLGAAVTAELRELSMPAATFTVTVRQHEADNGLGLADGTMVSFGENGIDTVGFLLAPHSGADPTPIGDGASGGELSRIMLALEVVLAESQPPAVFVFDEVDAGIGGRTAVEVGRRLARLAQHSQVLVVTHLPQVAAFADQHIVVQKDSDGQVTRSSITEVAGERRRQELARMLSGQDDSDVAVAHAGELLDLAARDRAGPDATAGEARAVSL